MFSGDDLSGRVHAVRQNESDLFLDIQDSGIEYGGQRQTGSSHIGGLLS